MIITFDVGSTVQEYMCTIPVKIWKTAYVLKNIWTKN